MNSGSCVFSTTTITSDKVSWPVSGDAASVVACRWLKKNEACRVGTRRIISGRNGLVTTIYKPWISAIWKGNIPTLLRGLTITIITTYSLGWSSMVLMVSLGKGLPKNFPSKYCTGLRRESYSSHVVAADVFVFREGFKIMWWFWMLLIIMIIHV